MVDDVRKQITTPTSDTIMSKIIPQSDIYKYLYNNYVGVRGFTAVTEHVVKLSTLNDEFEGARLDYHDTAFKVSNGIDGVSKYTGSPDRFYATIEYQVGDPNKLSIPKWKPESNNYPYTGRGFTGSRRIVLPEYYQQTREFSKGDLLRVIDSQTGTPVINFKFSKTFGWITKD
ncbi:hypothetical protein [Sporolactobacillus terrae]|nr:hypothetical protein [Sporolactobacillus terrae]